MSRSSKIVNEPTFGLGTLLNLLLGDVLNALDDPIDDYDDQLLFSNAVADDAR